MKRFSIVLALLLVMVASLSAREPVYVDLEKANQRLSDLQARIDGAEAQNNELRAENDSLEKNTQDQNNKISQARGIIETLRVSRGELYGARNRANDVAQKKRIIEQLEKNMAQEYQLQMMIDRFKGIINDNYIKSSANRKQIARNENNIEKDLEEVAFLNSSVELTTGNEGSLSDIFSRQDQTSSDFDSFMSNNQ